MASSLLQIFEQYQKARVQFVQSVAEAATRPQNIDTMQNAGVMQLLRPLLLDNVPSIQQTAALALGRLANYSDDLAEAVVANEILPQLVYSLGEQNVRGVMGSAVLGCQGAVLRLGALPTGAHARVDRWRASACDASFGTQAAGPCVRLCACTLLVATQSDPGCCLARFPFSDSTRRRRHSCCARWPSTLRSWRRVSLTPARWRLW